MAGEYHVHGIELSPYSVKVRSYFRYRGIPHRWIPRSLDSEGEYQKFAKLPLVPLVVTPENEGIQDSTPIIDRIEKLHPEPSIHPADPVAHFVSALIEEFGDEWGNKLMFHHRWFAEVDKAASSQTLARLSMPRATQDEVAARAGIILERMSGRGHFVGSSPANAPLITAYYLELIDVLEAHLATRRHLFGDRPAFADFGLAAQLYEASIDPTCGADMRARGPNVLDWCHRMLEARDDGPFEAWVSLEPTLAPLLAYVGRYFLPWTAANAAALQSGASEFTVDLPGGAYVQPSQKYHARSLAALRARYARSAPAPGLEDILAAAECLPYLS